ncbi:MAG: TonB-dependent receptor [Rudaea sp.]|uniref:TonB-dependent receptor plug domain-containing protein n=1 Tax=Rudaea sp. TaxID=2136325 RepID=UPI0039E271C4
MVCNNKHWSLNLFAAAIAAGVSTLAAAQDAANSTPSPSSLGTVIVTGTRASNRTEAESLSPIDVLTPRDLASTGSTDLGTALSALLPSLDFPLTPIGGSAATIRPLVLRGLSPDQVMILVDGKRYHTSSYIQLNGGPTYGSAPVDINSIPMSAIDHIEVLRDGASAQYGSDAIAGVVNIVLKHGARESSNNVTVNAGQRSKGDGAQNGVGGSYGFAFGHKDEDGKAPGWVRLSVDYQNEMKTNRAYNTDRATTAPGALPAGQYQYQRYGLPAIVSYQGLVSFGYAFSPAVEAYGYLTASHRKGITSSLYRSYNDARNIKAMYPDGFLPDNVSHPNDLNGVLGLRGTTESGWHWDASVDYGRSHLGYDSVNTLNTNMYYSLGYSPTNFFAGAYEYTQLVANLDMSKDFQFAFLPNVATVSWGYEFRRETYGISAGDPASYYYDPNARTPSGSIPAGSSQGTTGIQPASAGDWDRHDNAVYAGIETNLSDRLSTGFSARYENYNDAGSALAGKFSVRYQLTNALALRGTISNGFRAPALAQEYFTSVGSIVSSGQVLYSGTFPPTSDVAQSLGAKALKPEKSTNFGAGLVWNPTENFTSTLDAYQIRIGDRILYSSPLPLTDLSRGITSVQYFFNGATSRTRGADWVNSLSFNLDDYGDLKLGLSANWNSTVFLSLNPPTYVSNGVVTTTFGRNTQGNFTVSTPHQKYILGGDWQLRNGLGLHANLTRYGSVTNQMNPNELVAGKADQVYPARWLLDVSANYTWNAWTFTVGSDNLTNVYPQKNAVTNAHELGSFGVPYSALSPFGSNGRYVYGKINYRF